MRSDQRGGAMLITMIVIAALMAGAGVLVSIQLANTRTAEITRTTVTGQACAEAGLAMARGALANTYPMWASALQACGAGPYPCTEPPWLYEAIGSHDLDHDGRDDFAVYLRDDDDELEGTNDPTTDVNLRVFVVSRCLKYPDVQQQAAELVSHGAGGTAYESQQGGFTGNGNRN